MQREQTLKLSTVKELEMMNQGPCPTTDEKKKKKSLKNCSCYLKSEKDEELNCAESNPSTFFPLLHSPSLAPPYSTTALLL